MRENKKLLLPLHVFAGRWLEANLLSSSLAARKSLDYVKFVVITAVTMKYIVF
jgi:hypothetical protein